MISIKPSQSLLPEKSGERLHWGNLHGCALALALSEAVQDAHAPIIVIAPDSLSASRLTDEIRFFLGDADDLSKNENNDNEQSNQEDCTSIPVLQFPDRETLPYDSFSAHQDIISERLEILYRLPTLKQAIIVVSCTTLLHRLLPREFLELKSFVIDRGDNIDIETLRLRFNSAGYHYVSQVLQHGEYTLRGSVIDIFPMGHPHPFRIDLFDNEVDSIRIFDPETQRSTQHIKNIRLLPGHEFPLNDEGITLFRQNWRSIFQGNPAHCPLYQDISKGLNASGIEYYLPIFFKKTETFFDYLPEKSVIIKMENLDEGIKHFGDEVKERHEQLRYDITRPLLEPNMLFLNDIDFHTEIKRFSQIQIHKNTLETKLGRVNYNTQSPKDFSIDRKSKDPLSKLSQFLNETTQRILFCAESAGRREALLELFDRNNIKSKSIATWKDFVIKNNSNTTQNSVAMTTGNLSRGLDIFDPDIAIITESQLFGEQVYQQRKRKGKENGISDAVVRNLLELNVGDPVVHIDHGIGRYRGLETITLGKDASEFLVVTYAHDAKLYVPVSSLHLISRYTGADVEHAPLHRLGSEKWSNAKRKAAEKIRDVAAELLDLHAKRAAKKGFHYKEDVENSTLFSDAFPFEETPDQSKAIKDIQQDMCSDKSMDRLICGDVGFGKTEVAMRAAFTAVENHKQVAILVPTTLLAQQHYTTFKDRFADWPIRIEVISRFKTQKEQAAVLESAANGNIDILIGTHKLIQKGVKFYNLGLLIMDEEHRFGVRQKNQLKELRSEVDILSLTATPIPRTLNMAMTGIRDLSLITTPPAKRLSIKTFLHERTNHIIREAILREIMRGGQVFYLHNSVESIERRAQELQEIVPEIKIEIAHGQMRERELEKVMSDFYHRRFNLLLCTTIIENGIDVPTANTIIIERSDKFGLAQLHQLRGRVGRSHHQAYAYLLIPGKKLISRDATKRLDAITTYDDLGTGFMLATHDLEIRGAGELLGEEQSGHMQAIGFTLYMELLDRAVDSLKAGKTLNIETALNQVAEIELKIPALIPDDFVADVHSRLILYKRIANAKTNEALKDLQIEIIDRFGLLPQPLKNLFNTTEVKLRLEEIGIRKLDGNLKGGIILFSQEPKINPQHVMNLIQLKPKFYKFDGPDRLRFYIHDEIKNETLPDRIMLILDEICR